MTIPFIKMQACGNDYIYIDLEKTRVTDPAALAKEISKRHFSVGSDGIVLIKPIESLFYDSEMRIYNSDGSEGMVCGNALRCVGKYLYDESNGKRSRFKIISKTGVHEVSILSNIGSTAYVKVSLGKGSIKSQEDKEALTGKLFSSMKLKNEIESVLVNVGNEHLVLFNTPRAFNIERAGRLLDNAVNLETVNVISQNEIYVSVYERGSGITYSCGSGAAASVLACSHLGKTTADMPVKVKMKGGELEVEQKDGITYLSGGVSRVYEGEYLSADA